MRSLFPLPEQMKGFPAFIREAGYFTTNNVKTDYNSAAESVIKNASWDVCSDQAHWRLRKDNQPFFSVFNLMTSHQSRTMVWPYAQFQEEVQSKLQLTKSTIRRRFLCRPITPTRRWCERRKHATTTVWQ